MMLYDITKPRWVNDSSLEIYSAAPCEYYCAFMIIIFQLYPATSCWQTACCQFNAIQVHTQVNVVHWNKSIIMLGYHWRPPLLRKINSLVPGRFERAFRSVIFKLSLVIDGGGISCKIALRWWLLDLTHDKSTLVQVMAWCHQTRSHYLSQSWSRSVSPYNVTRPYWVKQD